MIADPRLPDSLGARIAALEARLRVLETSNRLQSSSIKGGTLTVYDTSDRRAIHIGSPVGAPAGVIVYAPDGWNGLDTVALYVDEEGHHIPFVPHAWRDGTGATVPPIGVTSSSFTETHSTRVEMLTAPMLWTTTDCYTSDAGTAGEVRISVTNGGVSSPAKPVGNTRVFQEFRWEHGLPIQSGPALVQVQVRRTAGTGTVWALPPASPLGIGGHIIPNV